MAHDRSGPDGLHMQAMTDPSQSVSSCLRGTPTVFDTTAQKWSAARIFAEVSALRLRSLPSSRHLAPPSGLSHHHSIVVTAPPCSLFDARAASASFFAPARRIRPFLSPPPPPFFAPARRIRPFLCPSPSPPPHTTQVALHPRSFFLSLYSTSFPVPPPSPSRGVHSALFHFLRHLPASAVDLPLRVEAHRVLFVFALLTIALY